MTKSYVIACLINLNKKTISITARDPKESKCNIFNINGVDSLFINDEYMPIIKSNITRNEARDIKAQLINTWVNQANYKLISSKVVA